MKWSSIVCAAVALVMLDAQAVVTLSGTRLIFDGRFREASLEVTNPGSAEVLIQVWLQSAREPGGPTLPFAVTPALAQLPAQGKQALRVLYEGVGMPGDRESLLHLYVLEVPRRHAARQQLSLAVRQRINVFYRPTGLAGDPAEAAGQLLWQRSSGPGAALNVSNPTPFHVSVHQVIVNGVELSDDLMLTPFSTHSLTLPPAVERPSESEHLTFKALTDYGGSRDFCAQPQGHAPYNATLRAAGTHSSIGKC